MDITTHDEEWSLRSNEDMNINYNGERVVNLYTNHPEFGRIIVVRGLEKTYMATIDKRIAAYLSGNPRGWESPTSYTRRAAGDINDILSEIVSFASNAEQQRSG